MSLDQAIEAEAQAQAICMQTQDFRRAYEAFVAKEQADVRGGLRCRQELSQLAVLRGAPPRAGRRRSTPGRQPILPAVDHARRRRRLPRAGRRNSGEAGWLTLTAPDDGRRSRSTCARSRSRARRWRAMTGSPISPSPCRASAPGRSRCSAATAQRAAWLPTTRAGKAIAAFALTEPASGSDVANIAMTARRDGDGLRARRREDLDFERRHRRPLRRVRAHRRGARRARPLGLHRARRQSGPRRRRAHRR